jgi:hypothetical protein
LSDARHAVLELLLDHHPALLSVDELVCEITAGSGSFEERDRIEVAVRSSSRPDWRTDSMRSCSHLMLPLASGTSRCQDLDK